MISFFLSLLVFASTASAQSVCYTPSDCAFPQHCSSLDDGQSPGICVPVPEAEKKPALPPTPAYTEEVVEEPKEEIPEVVEEETEPEVTGEESVTEDKEIDTSVEEEVEGDETEEESDDEPSSPEATSSQEGEDDSFFGFIGDTVFDPMGDFFETIWCTFFCE